ncbi:unnamed protein product [Spodoptera littoralis]|uniref:CUB domain-containing protein n=1 Tax=Spodoptera littoralis TaxID=7109 RepID=A0A9P0IKW5_SPOLI|nr:unnamed protein product [Spodoptera littoralis]CAH1647629.1 unnamed protein product [Spodoptera littoralis]
MLSNGVFLAIVCVVLGADQGFLLLYRPIDVTNECAFSGRLRYDVSFGMGMSDTVTLVFRTIYETDYTCNIDIVVEGYKDTFLVVVIKFPTSIAINCRANTDAFHVMKKNKCFRLCDLVASNDLLSDYFVITVKGRIRFKFRSNSSINSDINADLYQVTATSARAQPPTNCNPRNETLCVIDTQEFCFTNGVVCDGIKNCGVSDWFDERKSECGLPVEYLGHAPVIAVVGAIVCALLAGGHILMRCLPPLANSFFIFNANEDNRFCIDPVFVRPEKTSFEVGRNRRASLIPTFSSSSSSYQSDILDIQKSSLIRQSGGTDEDILHYYPSVLSIKEPRLFSSRSTTMKSMTARLQKTIRSVTGRRKIIRASLTGPDTINENA